MEPPVFADVFGQPAVVARLARAADAGRNGGRIAHAWLLIGPAGSGRSVAANAFAAALQCPEGGCGECSSCRAVAVGSHPDVKRVVPAGLSIGVEEMRALVLHAAAAPTLAAWQVVIIEDADRLTEAAANALLKAIEEPASHTIFLLCAPSLAPEDVPATIRSRCQLLVLRSPSVADIAAGLAAEGVEAATGSWAAAVAQRHVGRARRLATDGAARDARQHVLSLPATLRGPGECFTAAADLLAATETEARSETAERDAAENSEFGVAFGAGGTGKGTATVARSGAATAKRELAKKQKSRATRSQRDALDRALVDLAAYYRDALLTALGVATELVHPDFQAATAQLAAGASPEDLVNKVNTVLACRDAIAANVKPRIALEAMFVRLGS